jgi:hypothetical protein
MDRPNMENLLISRFEENDDFLGDEYESSPTAIVSCRSSLWVHPCSFSWNATSLTILLKDGDEALLDTLDLDFEDVIGMMGILFFFKI